MTVIGKILSVVLDTTKVQIFKQITTTVVSIVSSKGCFRYHKGTDFQANHNKINYVMFIKSVVLDTTKVQIFKQITTDNVKTYREEVLF